MRRCSIAHHKGLIDEATLDLAVKRLFRTRMRLGMFDPPEQVPYSAIPYEVVNSPEHRALTLQAARESIVLLKNDGLLPLSKEIGSIAVIGPNADDLMTLLGNYNGTPAQAVTPLEGIRRAVSAKTAVYTAKGCPIADGVPNLSVIPSEFLRPATADGPQHGLTAAYYRRWPDRRRARVHPARPDRGLHLEEHHPAGRRARRSLRRALDRLPRAAGIRHVSAGRERPQRLQTLSRW